MLNAIRRRAGVLLVATFALSAVSIAANPATPVSAAPVVYNGAGETWQFGLIGDSAWAGIRWTNSFGPMQRYNFRADLESCRRTIGASCRGREGYAPPTTLASLRQQAGRWGAVLVVATGYNDPGTTFASAVDQVMAEAISQQIYRVVWMTMRNADVTYVSPGFISNATTFRDNNRILLQKAEQYGGRLQIADWASYSAGHREWFTSDGIHLLPNGARAAADFIAQSAGNALNGVAYPSSAPATDWVNVSPGDSGTRVVIVQQYLARAGIGIFGGADGRYGPYTAGAVREFQARVGLPQTGVLDKATAIRLGLWYNDGSVPTTPSGSDWVNVSPGDSGMRVAIVHEYLRRAGIAVNGDADGRYGAVTSAAVEAFQSRSGLPASGIVDKATAIRLGLWPGGGTPPSGPAGDWVNVSPGDRGMRVAIVHTYLRRAGIAVNGDADGSYGAVTTAAVRAFQTRIGLPATGVVDRATAIELGLWPRPATGAAMTMAVAADAAAEASLEVAPPTSEVAEPATSEPATSEPATSEPETSEPETSEPETSVPDSATAILGDFVWLDLNGDGKQDVGEGGLEGITVSLLDDSLAPLAEVVSDRDGHYEFAGLEAATYVVEFVVPEGYAPSTVDSGTDDAIDSDINPLKVLEVADEVVVRVPIAVDGATKDLDLDAGFVVAPAEPDAPPSSEAPASTEGVDIPETSSPATTEAPATSAVTTITAAPETSVPPTDPPPPTQPEPPAAESSTSVAP